MVTTMSANESATIGDIRTGIFGSLRLPVRDGGWYASTMSCLSVPTGGDCILARSDQARSEKRSRKCQNLSRWQFLS